MTNPSHELRRQQEAELAAQLDPPMSSQTYLERVGELNMSRLMAAEMIREAYAPIPEPDSDPLEPPYWPTDPDHPLNDPNNDLSDLEFRRLYQEWQQSPEMVAMTQAWEAADAEND